MTANKVRAGLLMVAGLLAAAGCGQQPVDKAATGTPPTKGGDVAKAGAPKPAPADASEEDGGVWCNPHGVAEEECSMCSAKAAKEAKAKGDWCDTHERAKSQCYVCDPTLLEKAKATYRAKYGKEMPTPKKNMPEKK